MVKDGGVSREVEVRGKERKGKEVSSEFKIREKSSRGFGRDCEDQVEPNSLRVS